MESVNGSGIPTSRVQREIYPTNVRGDSVPEAKNDSHSLWSSRCRSSGGGSSGDRAYEGHALAVVNEVISSV